MLIRTPEVRGEDGEIEKTRGEKRQKEQRERWNQYRYADIEIFFSHRSCNRGLWNIWPKYQAQGWNKFCVLWNKRNISRTQLVERTIAVYYSSTYRSAFGLSYKVRSSVSFSVTFNRESKRLVKISLVYYESLEGQHMEYAGTVWPQDVSWFSLPIRFSNIDLISFYKSLSLYTVYSAFFIFLVYVIHVSIKLCESRFWSCARR